MQSFVLVIDEDTEIASLCRQVLSGTDAKVVVAKDAVSAKGLLIQSIPRLLICSLKLGEVEDAGFRLCEELQAREEFSAIPMLIVADELRQGYTERAREVGLHGILAWPLTQGDFRTALSAHFSLGGGHGGMDADFEVEFEDDSEPEEPAPSKANTQTQGAVVQDEKLALAQNLLAQVLHALRTSDLLSVAEVEDVPQIVFEMTRGVCGQQAEPKRAASEQGAEEPETSLNLDSVFGLKKG